MMHQRPPRLALETTLLLHGVPRESALLLAQELGAICRERGVEPALVGVVSGRAVVGMSEAQLRTLLGAPIVPKINTSTLGVTMARGGHGATSVSATLELAAGEGVRVFATGGLGGVHKDLPQRLDISADLLALTRHPVAVVASGCKSLLDVRSTREMLETLGVPVIGYQCDRFPAFYTRDGGIGVDARFDDLRELAAYARRELNRTARGIVVCNPIPPSDDLDPAQFDAWLALAQSETRDQTGRDVTPAILQALHRLSHGATLRANIALVKNNVALGAQLAAAMAG